MNTTDEWEKEVEELNKSDYRKRLDEALDEADALVASEYARDEIVSHLYAHMERIFGEDSSAAFAWYCIHMDRIFGEDSYADKSRGK